MRYKTTINNFKLTAKQAAAIEVLLTGGNITQAAEAAGVTRAAVYRWQELPQVKTAMAEAQNSALQRISRALVYQGDTAVKVLNEAMTNPEMPAALRIRAADIIISRIIDIKEMIDFEGRLAELEKAIAEQKAGNSWGDVYGRPRVDYRDAIQPLKPEGEICE